MRLRQALLLLLGLPVLGCTAGGGACGDGLALRGVTVIDGLGSPSSENQTVVICDGRISAVGPAAEVDVPRGAKEAALPGRTVMPGLIDTHAHVTILPLDEQGRVGSAVHRADSEATLRTLLAFGVTTVRNPAAPAVDAVHLRDEVAAGRVLGPRIVTAGEALNPTRAPFGPFVAVNTAEEVREEVQRQAELGVDLIKVYAALPEDLVAAAISAAHQAGLPVVGHLQRTSWTEGARLGIDLLTHAAPWTASYLPEDQRAGYGGSIRDRLTWLEAVDLDGPEITEMTEALVAAGVSIDPTLLVQRTKFFGDDPRHVAHPELELAPMSVRSAWSRGTFTSDWSAEDYARGRAVWPKLLGLTRRLHAAGVPLTAGSDLPNPWVIPGVSLHEELQLLVDAGIPPLEVLRIATHNGAVALGLADDVGSIEAGKRADLVVLAGDPLGRMANTRAIEFVLLGGRVLSPAALLAGEG